MNLPYAPPPPGWDRREPKHFEASDKATIPGALGAKIVGLSFVDDYPSNLHALAVLHGTEREPRLVLRRNPDNPHDANAVEVRAERPPDRPGEPIMLGHLPRALAARIAPELDAGEPWHVAAWQALEHPQHPNQPGLSIDLRRG